MSLGWGKFLVTINAYTCYVIVSIGENFTYFYIVWRDYKAYIPILLVIRASVPKLVLNSVYEQNNQIMKAVEEELERDFPVC